MQISLTTGRHLTATNKRHIAEMIGRGQMKGATARIQYEFDTMGDGVAALTVYTKDKTDYGRVFWRNQAVTISYKGD